MTQQRSAKRVGMRQEIGYGGVDGVQVHLITFPKYLAQQYKPDIAEIRP